MQLLASKYCLMFVILAIVLLSFKFGGDDPRGGSEQLTAIPKNAQKNTQKNTQKIPQKTRSNLITNCDIRGAEQITPENSIENCHNIIMDSIYHEHINYNYSAGQLYTLAVIEKSTDSKKPFSYLCFLAINIPENNIHKGTVIAKYRKSLTSHLRNTACFKVIAYRQSSYLRNVEKIQVEKIRNDWDLQGFVAKHKLIVF